MEDKLLPTKAAEDILRADLPHSSVVQMKQCIPKYVVITVSEKCYFSLDAHNDLHQRGHVS